MLTWRDVFQWLSIGLSAYSLLLIARKVRRNRRSLPLWLPMITIMIFTVAFYALILLDLLGRASSDWSSTRSLAIQIALLIYVRNMPPETHS